MIGLNIDKVNKEVVLNGVHNERSNNSKGLSFNTRYAINAGLVVTVTLVEAMANRMLSDNAIGSKASNTGASLLISMPSATFISKVLKGNWRDVSSYKQQLLVLAAHNIVALGCDALAFYTISKSSEQQSVIGQATVIAAMINLGLLTKMMAYHLVNQRTYTRGPAVSENDNKSINMNARRIANAGLIVALSSGAALSNLLLQENSGTNVVLNMSFSQSFSKGGKAGIKSVDERKYKILTVLSYGGLAAVSAALMGAAVKWDPQNEEGYHRAFSAIYHYLGPVTGIALTGIATNLIFRAMEKKKNAQSGHVKKSISVKKKAIHASAFVATNIGAAVTHGLNVHYFKSPTVSLGTKLFQAGWTYHSGREIMKGLTKTSKQLLVIGSQLLVGATVEFTARAIDPARIEQTNFWDMPVLAVTTATAAAFFGKMLRNKLLPKPELHAEQAAAPVQAQEPVPVKKDEPQNAKNEESKENQKEETFEV